MGANFGYGSTKASEVWKDMYDKNGQKPEVVSEWEDDVSAPVWASASEYRSINFFYAAAASYEGCRFSGLTLLTS